MISCRFRRLAAKAGTDYGEGLTRDAFDTVQQSGEPEPWMREVQRARDAGLLSPGVAWFLLYKFVEVGMYPVTETDPELKRLGARIEEIERAHGLGEDESFFVGEGPPEWEEATQAWEVVFEQRFRELLHRVGEDEMAAMHVDGGDDPRFAAGREAIFGPLQELDPGYELS